MKILFTNSPLNFSHGHTFTQADWQTLILPYLAGIAGKEHSMRLLDNANYSFWKSDNILGEVKKFNPEILGISIIASRDIFNTLDRIKKIRKENPNLKIIAGGQAGTYYDRWLLQSGVDFIVRGEGEKTIPELLRGIEEKEDDFKNIKGISYMENGEVERTSDRELIYELDNTPFPRWDLMPKIKSLWFKNRFVGSIEMSRGCPHKCNFCAITTYWKGKFRKKSNERIIEELKFLKKEGRSHIYLADDNFGVNSKEHMDLFEKMIKEDISIKFFTQIRADTVARHPEMIKLASKAGLYGVLIGFDTYNSKTFDAVTKKGSIELNLKSSEILRKESIAIFGSHIYGLPDQKTPFDFIETFKKGRKNSDLFRMPYFSPLPGTSGYEDYVKINPRDMNLEEVLTRQEDFRPRFGDKSFQKKMARGYNFYNWVHNLSPSEIFGALAHPNPIVRKFKQRGYIGVFRHHFYKILRKLGTIEI